MKVFDLKTRWRPSTRTATTASTTKSALQYRLCSSSRRFLAFVKTQVNNLLASGISGGISTGPTARETVCEWHGGHSSLPESIGPAKKTRAPVQDISNQKCLGSSSQKLEISPRKLLWTPQNREGDSRLGCRKRQTSDVVTAAEVDKRIVIEVRWSGLLGSGGTRGPLPKGSAKEGRGGRGEAEGGGRGRH